MLPVIRGLLGGFSSPGPLGGFGGLCGSLSRFDGNPGSGTGGRTSGLVPSLVAQIGANGEVASGEARSTRGLGVEKVHCRRLVIGELTAAVVSRGARLDHLRIGLKAKE